VLKTVKVFVASPNDVVKERKQVQVVCDELNRTLGRFLKLELKILDWFQVPPGSGNPEELILDWLKPDEWDIFIGIFWMRFGSPTGSRIDGSGQAFLSGTEQEFKAAYDRWKQSGQPRIMVYRCVRPPRSLTDFDSEQYRSVEQFFNEFDGMNEHPGLFGSYRTVGDFERTVRMDLAAYLIQGNPTLRRRLADMLPRHFLQVLLRQFSISNGLDNQVLTIELGGELELVTDTEEREDFHTRIRANPGPRDQLMRSLAQVAKQGPGHSSVVDCREWPLRYGNGGVLPVVRVNGTRHLCLFYRETFPTGWNIANGASDNYPEILNPERVLLREFSEELLIVDEAERAFYCFRPGSEPVPLSYQTAAIKAWADRLGRPEYESYAVKDLQVREWIKGEDSVKVTMGREECLSKNYFLSITPTDNAIEVDRVAYIDLDLCDHHKMLDGEGLSVGRIVGLFNEDHFVTDLLKAKSEEHKFYPDVFYFEGERFNTPSFEASVDEFRSRLRPRPKSGRADQREMLAHPFGLCPVTRAVATHYANWLRTHSRAPS